MVKMRVRLVMGLDYGFGLGLVCTETCWYHCRKYFYLVATRYKIFSALVQVWLCKYGTVQFTVQR